MSRTKKRRSISKGDKKDKMQRSNNKMVRMHTFIYLNLLSVVVLVQN